MFDKFSKLKDLNHKVFKEYEEAIANAGGKKELRLEIPCEAINRNLFKGLGIPVSGIEYEEGNFKYSAKRPDALYSNVILEYKAVGILDSPAKREGFIDQVKGYINKSDSPEKMIGVLFDGKHVIFIKRQKGSLGWILNEKDFSEISLFEMLLLLVNLHKKKLSPENLKNDFDTQNILGKQMIKTMFKKILKTENPRTLMLYREWEKRFSSIYKHAFENDKVRKDFEKIMKGFELQESDYNKFLFVLQTYYAFIVKLIASEAASTVAHELVGSYIDSLSNSDNLKKDLVEIEDGGIFRQSLKIDNFIEGDFFSWYLEEWDKELEKQIKDVLEKMREYNFATFVEIPEETKDLLKRFYQYVVPKQIRHDLGEYYTPDWLAQYLIDKTGYDGDPNKKVLDPACGSGTFLVEIIKKIYAAHKGKGMRKSTIAKLITENVVGFDINPIAVLTARTNYLLALSPFLREFGFERVFIPVFLTDSIVLPEETMRFNEKAYKIETTKIDFFIPSELVDKGLIDSIFSDMEPKINDYSVKDFTETVKKDHKLSQFSLDLIAEIFSKIKKLNDTNENKVWTKIIRNSFAPVFRKNQFDFVIGNPPWVNWEFLSDDYAKLLAKINNDYDIFAFSGAEARLGHTRLDMFTTFVYVSADKYLKPDGRLGFVVKPLFQNPAGKGFRRFSYKVGDKREFIGVRLVEDMKEMNPFEGAQNETSIIILDKGQKTKYPIPYIHWSKKSRGEVPQDASLETVLKTAELEKQIAEPSDKNDLGSGWIIFDKSNKEFANIRQNFLGEFEYPIRQGVNFGISTVLWFEIKDKIGNKIRIQNSSERNVKFNTKPFETTIEKDLVFPLIKSRHLSKWKLDGYIYALVPQKVMNEENESEIKTKYRLTYEYLLKYKRELQTERKSIWFKRGPFYSIYSVREYTWAPFKVAWVNLGYKPEFVVISYANDKLIGNKPILPEHVLSFVSEREKEGKPISEDEAHYICAIMNSSPIREVIDALSQKGKSGLTATLLGNIRLEKFDKNNNLHKKLSELSKKAHQAAKDADESKLKKIEKEIDNEVFLLYTKKEKKNLEKWLSK